MKLELLREGSDGALKGKISYRMSHAGVSVAVVDVDQVLNMAKQAETQGEDESLEFAAYCREQITLSGHPAPQGAEYFDYGFRLWVTDGVHDRSHYDAWCAKNQVTLCYEDVHEDYLHAYASRRIDETLEGDSRISEMIHSYCEWQNITVNMDTAIYAVKDFLDDQIGVILGKHII
jgi:hypothetical protein